MQILVAPSESFILSERTTFSADEAASQTVLSVENAGNFSANDYIVLGEIGSETAEVRQVASTDVTSITISVVTSFTHTKDSNIQKLLYNQRKFYRCSTETGTYSHLASEGSPIDIQVDRPEGTEFEDSTGTSASWYKATYYNETSGIETSLADAVATKAGDAEHYTSVYKIKNESGFRDNDYIGSDLVDRYRTEAEAQAEGAVASIYSLPFSSSPKLFQHIVTLLAAGLLLSKEYGMEADVEISKTGQRKIERAQELLEKIQNSTIVLIGEDGTELSKRTDVMASGSNVYDADVADRGELFNLETENFNLTDPEKPLSSSIRNSNNSKGFK